MTGNFPLPTDSMILSRINQLFLEHALIDHSKIEVEVNDGEVTLKGKADTEEEKEATQILCASVDGVKKVENKLTIDAPVIHTLTNIVSQIISGDKPDKKDDTGS